MPSGSYAKLAKSLSRRHAAVLIQLRSGHIPLNKYLHQIGKISSPLCQECGKNESVFHYLIKCRRYVAQRKKMEGKLKRDARSLKTLLSNPLALTTLFKYIGETGRLNDIRKDWEFTKEEKERWDKKTNKKGKKRNGTGQRR